ncbi:MAG TPA: phosphoribosyltransferase family protein [Gammaproteobacteria bacterium]|nr:phosphoribosyltransferase family protein [Gammaproteobacteria bacterium]
MQLPFTDRTEAGRRLAEALRGQGVGGEAIVLGLPRGGVPVAEAVARVLGAELDIIIVRKLGLPGQEELAMGAIASGGGRALNEDLAGMLQLDEADIARVEARERRELERREKLYRGERPAPAVADREVVLVDDGLATGATMRAAVAAVRSLGPARVVVAVPVAPSEAVERLRAEADEVICLATPEPFLAVGRWYRDFGQTSDAEVGAVLARAWGEDSGGAGP